jgi:hypothetical protein
MKPSPEISEVMTPRKRWLGGKQQQVTWSSTGDVPQIDVLLYHGHYFLKTLCRNAPNIGSIAVRTPVGLTPGPYMLRVASNVNRHDVHASTPIEIDPDVREADSNPRPFALLELEFLCSSSLQSAEGRTFESHSGRPCHLRSRTCQCSRLNGSVDRSRT